MEALSLWINVLVHCSDKTSKFIHVKGRFLPATGKADILTEKIFESKK